MTIDSTNPSTINSAGSSTIIWHASENGTYSVRKGGTNCSDGTQLNSGTYSTSPNTTNVTINGSDLSVGANTIRICLTDSATNTGSATTTVTIQNNQAPTADSKTLSANEDTPLAITLTGSDPDGDALTFTVITPPAHGTLGSIGTVSCTGNPSNCSENITNAFVYVVNRMRGAG